MFPCIQQNVPLPHSLRLLQGMNSREHALRLAVHPLEKSPTQHPAPPAIEQLLVPLKPHPTVPATQLFPPTHLFPLAHPVVLFSVQLVPHAVADAQPKFPGHAAVLVPVTQVPLPLHDPLDVNIPLLQVELPQLLPATCNRHAPAPLHMPSCPQALPVSTAHSLSGSVPALIGRHFPSCPPVFKAEHAMQLPLHALSQQSPSTHDPEEHSLLVLQVVPFAFVSWQT